MIVVQNHHALIKTPQARNKYRKSIWDFLVSLFHGNNCDEHALKHLVCIDVNAGMPLCKIFSRYQQACHKKMLRCFMFAGGVFRDW
jgi:hypothetical protein